MNREVVIGFSRPKGFFKPFSWVIRFAEGWAPYSHVYLKTKTSLTDQNLIYQASGAQVNFVGEKHFLDHVVIHREFTFQISEDAFREYMRFAIDYAGAPYDLRAVLGVLFVRLFKLKSNPLGDGDKSFYCAELVARAMKDYLGLDTGGNLAEDAGPRQLYKLISKIQGE